MAKSGSERTTAWRAELVKQGYRQKAFLLSPAAQAALAALAKRYGSERDALETVVIKAAGRSA